MKNRHYLINKLKALLLIWTIALLSCNNSTNPDFNYHTKEEPILRDTTYSEKLLDLIKFQVLDYIEISSKREIDKFIKYTPKFLHECTIIDGENFSKKYETSLSTLFP